MRVSDKNIDRVYISSAVRSVDYHMVENHYHYYYEIYYVRHGKCRMYINNALYTMEGGDLMIVPPMMNHYTRYLSQCTRINLYFKLSELYADEDGFFSKEAAKQLDDISVVHIPRTYRELINSLFDNMIAEEKIDDEDTLMIQRLSLKHLLLYIKRYGIHHKSTDSEHSDVEIIKAVQYINENYSQPITLESLANIAGLSSTYFSKKFRTVTGSGMKEYLNYIRLNHAAMELKSTDNSITDVALNCGFNNSNYFKDSFKKMYGMSPRAYRKSRENDHLKEMVDMKVLDSLRQ